MSGHAREVANAAASSASGHGALAHAMLAFNVLLGGAGVYLTAYPPGTGSESRVEDPVTALAAQQAARDDRPLVRVQRLIVQLRAREGERHARIGFDLQIASEGDRDAVMAHLPQIRDIVIRYYADHTGDEVAGSRGIERAKVALLAAIRRLMPRQRPTNLFVTDFIVL